MNNTVNEMRNEQMTFMPITQQMFLLLILITIIGRPNVISSLLASASVVSPPPNLQKLSIRILIFYTEYNLSGLPKN